jgi:L-threonylcarbamoyladenylate synthase
MKVLTLTRDSEQMVIDESVKILKRGGVIAYPTESFYALGVIATDTEAVKRLFKLKGRPSDKPVPVIAGNMDVLRSIVKEVPSQAYPLISRYWPGPLTLIFEAIDTLPALLTGGTGRVGVRIPGQSPALLIATQIDLPITATSANPSSLPPAISAEMVRGYFDREIDLIVDGGDSPGGRPSTIIDVTSRPPRIIRHGRLTIDPTIIYKD